MAQKLWDEKYFNHQLENDLMWKRISKGVTYNKIPDDSLVYQTDGPYPRISFRPAPSQKVIKKRGAYIVFGKDRPAGLASGYGGKGATRSDAIDIVVGRMSSARKGKGPKKGSVVDNNFGADAARIYISELTDIDANFGITAGVEGMSTARSGIGIKADAVRIIGREGVKIVTGKAPFPGIGGTMGETNSRGGRIRNPAPQIELLAGNSDQDKKVRGGIYLKSEEIKTIQPVPKGQNLELALLELQMLLEKIMSAVYNLALVQTSFNATLGAEPLLTVTKGAGPIAASQVLTACANSIWQTRINSNMWAANYCYPVGYRYINSSNVSTT
tara:strand:+ start:2299 stop:3285 length:987 start_codon:yes stop_codon:yes gene_type:complete